MHLVYTLVYSQCTTNVVGSYTGLGITKSPMHLVLHGCTANVLLTQLAPTLGVLQLHSGLYDQDKSSSPPSHLHLYHILSGSKILVSR
jgi:hypothetical protein